MVPDLPYVREDVPDGSEATWNTGSLRNGWSEVVHSGAGRRPRARRCIVDRDGSGRAPAVRRVAGGRWPSSASAVCLTLAVSPAAADDLTDRRDEVKQQIAQTKNDLSESSHRPDAAGDRGRHGPRPARPWPRPQLAADPERAGGRATAEDIAMAAKLKKARPTWPRPRPRSSAGQRRARRPEGHGRARWSATSTSSRPTCCRSRCCSEPQSPADLQTRLQWSTTMFDTAAGRDRPADRASSASSKRPRRGRPRWREQVAADRKAAADEPRGQAQALEARAATAGGQTSPAARSSGEPLSAPRPNDVAADKAPLRQAERRSARRSSTGSPSGSPRPRPRRPARRGRTAAAGLGAAAARQRARPGARRPRRARAEQRARGSAARRGRGPRRQLGRAERQRLRRDEQLERRLDEAPVAAPAARSASTAFILPGHRRRSPPRTACASTRSCTTGSCTTAPTSAPAAAPRSGRRTPAGSRSVLQRRLRQPADDRPRLRRRPATSPPATTTPSATRSRSASTSARAR